MGITRAGRALCAVAASSLLTSACTTQLRAVSMADKPPLAEGQVYHLPRVDYLVSVDRELTQCTFGFGTDADAVLVWTREAARVMSTAKDQPSARRAFDSLVADPIFTRPDIRAAVDFKLGAGWQAEVDPKNHAQQALEVKFQGVELPRAGVQLKVEMAASALPIVANDPAHVYVLRYQGMREWSKASNYSVETYPSGTLKSINVNLDDQTGTIVQSALSGVAKLASASMGMPLPVVTAQSGKGAALIDSYADWKKKQAQVHQALNPCKTSVQAALLQRKAHTDAIGASDDGLLALTRQAQEAEGGLAEAIEAHDKQRAIVDVMADTDKGKPAALALLKALEQKIKVSTKNLADVMATQQDAGLKHGQLQGRLAGTRKALTVTAATTVLLESNSPAVTLDGVQQAYDSWFDPGRVGALCSQHAQACGKDGLLDIKRRLHAEADVYPRGVPLGAIVKEEAKRTVNGKEVTWQEVDVVYRQPLRTTLYVCKETACLDQHQRPSVSLANRLIAAPVDIPQLGILATLPLKNVGFQNNTLAASFSELGTLTKVTYTSNAVAAKAMQVFDSSADSVLKFKDAKRKQESERLKLGKEELDLRAALLKSQLELEKAKVALDQYRAVPVAADGGE